MAQRQFYRSSLMFKALRAKEVCQNYKEVITPENDKTISSNPDRQPIYLSEDPVPGPSRTSEIDNDNVSEISDLFDSDDSVADPDFSVSDLFSSKYTAIESDDDFTELAIFLETRKSTVRSILPKSDNTKRDESIFIATYPDSIIFKDQQQTISFNVAKSPVF
ncbi:hypothetical protein ACJJTC_014479 [Scirpophaga incertulas]